jgi:hypothetical protein
MAQAVSRRPVTAEARVRARICVICDGQSGIGTVFSLSSYVSPCHYNSTVAFHTHVSCEG